MNDRAYIALTCFLCGVVIAFTASLVITGNDTIRMLNPVFAILLGGLSIWHLFFKPRRTP